MSAPAERPAAAPLDLDAARTYLARVGDVLIHEYEDDLDLFPLAVGLLAEVDRLRAIEAAAEAHRAAYWTWHNWRPCAGMGHGHADRYAETRDALWAALATGGPRAARGTGEEES